MLDFHAGSQPTAPMPNDDGIDRHKVNYPYGIRYKYHDGHSQYYPYPGKYGIDAFNFVGVAQE